MKAMSTQHKNSEKVRSSKAYRSAKSRANQYSQDPEKLSHLASQVLKKLNHPKGAIIELSDQIKVLVRMIRAYIKREYTVLPWESLLLMVASLIYFVMPIDLIPDFLIGLGFADDAALIGWTLKSIQHDLQQFEAWEASFFEEAE